MRYLLPIALLLFARASHAFADEPSKPTAVKWSFKSDQGSDPRDEISGALGKIEGKYKYVPGVSGDGLRLDGYTTSMTVSRSDVPSPGTDGLTVEAWLALDTYPWNWVPLVEQESQHQAGFSLGVDAFGHVAFGVSINGQWHAAISTATLPLKRWTHVAGIYATHDGHGVLTVLVNGLALEQLKVEGEYTPARTLIC